MQRETSEQDIKRQQVIRQALTSRALPTLPQVASRVLSVTSDAESSIVDLAEVIETDAALTADLLRVVNSPYYGFRTKVKTVSQATALLGMNPIRSIVLSFSFISSQPKSVLADFDFELFWKKSLAGAVAATHIMHHVSPILKDELFIAALLRDIGELMLFQLYPEEMAEIRELDKYLQPQAEEERIGISHSDLGAEVLKSWSFPEELTTPINCHHAPDSDFQSLSDKHRGQCLFITDLIVDLIFAEKTESYSILCAKLNEFFDLTTVDIDVILSSVHEQINDTIQSFGLSHPPVEPIAAILEEANWNLRMLTLSADEMHREYSETRTKLEKLTLELAQKNKDLVELANRDGLTGIHNYRYFQDALDLEINRAARNDKNFSLLMFDLDHFKRINDQYSHQAGDFVLKNFCKLLQKNIRNYDVFARYGGEEFVLILPETTEEEAIMIAEKLRIAVELEVFVNQTEEYRVTTSIGVTNFNTKNTCTKFDLMRQADRALYLAKETRNIVRAWSEV